jgi:hypothetical protein
LEVATGVSGSCLRFREGDLRRNYIRLLFVKKRAKAYSMIDSI